MTEESSTYEFYLNGSLSGEERLAFDRRLLADQVFAEDFNRFREMWQLVQLAGEAQLRRRLMDIHAGAGAGREGGGRIRRIRTWSWLAVAASVIAAIGITWFLYERNVRPAELYAAHMQAYPAPDIVRSEDAAADPWSRFGELYAAGRYDEAHRLITTVTDDQAPAYMVSFYRGQCELLRNGGDPGAAIAAFDEVLRSDNDMHALAHWYTALAALKADDPAKARMHLHALLDGDGYKREQAKALLRAVP
ncbi:MAG: tetratricopeptide repeat protein [Flavobacteriales bacterium]|nr:tetratricopeptide repeat protein [Flavobacteriales bacterium]